MDIFKPVQFFADLVTYQWLHLAQKSYLADTVNFFIYDAIKIGILLVAINYLMAVIRYYFPVEKVRNILTKRRWFGMDYLLAALLGVITPFCSCSSIPLFMGFVSAGIPLGVTFAFLISSPLVNEASLYLFPALFGMNVTIIYNFTGIIIAIVGGVIIQHLKMEKYLKPELLKYKSRKQREKEHKNTPLPLKQLLLYFWQDGMAITKKIFPYMLFGVGTGSLIHGFVPHEVIEKYLSLKEWWTVPIASLLGAPFYAGSVSIIPIMEALVEKGVPLGTALAFMTAVVTISIPELIMLKKIMKLQLLMTFFGITVVGIMVMGYLFNAIF